MIAAIQLLEYLHTLDICNPLQCKHMIQVFFLMLENKLIYSPKVKYIDVKKNKKQKTNKTKQKTISQRRVVLILGGGTSNFM